MDLNEEQTPTPSTSHDSPSSQTPQTPTTFLDHQTQNPGAQASQSQASLAHLALPTVSQTTHTGDLPYGFDVRPSHLRPRQYRIPDKKNGPSCNGAPWLAVHKQYLFYLLERAMKYVLPRKLQFRDFKAITEALHRRFRHTTLSVPYPERGFNAVHSYAVKQCKNRYNRLQARVLKSSGGGGTGGAGAGGIGNSSLGGSGGSGLGGSGGGT